MTLYRKRIIIIKKILLLLIKNFDFVNCFTVQIPEYVLVIGNIGGFLEVFNNNNNNNKFIQYYHFVQVLPIKRGHLLVHLKYGKVLSTWSTNPCMTSYRQTEHPTYVTTGQLLVQSLSIPAARLSLRYIMDAAFQNNIEDSSVVSVLLCPDLCNISQIYILLDIFVPLFLISSQAS